MVANVTLATPYFASFLTGKESHLTGTLRYLRKSFHGHEPQRIILCGGI
jgi:hypothetical protein